MALPGFDELASRADLRRRACTVAVAGASDATVLSAMRTACDRGWIQPLLVGDESSIRRTAAEQAIAINGFECVDSRQPAVDAVAAVTSGRAQLLMKGNIATPDLMQAVLDAGGGLRTARTICQVVLMEIAGGRRFLLADTGICVQPTREQKADILLSAVDLCRALGVAEPRAALLAASEKVSDKMPETVDAAELVQLCRGGEWAGCHIQGPLSFDLAYAADAGDKKRLSGPVIGAADIMLFPNLLSANLTVKAMMYTADCRFGGMLCGAACPVVFMSRADSVATRLHSLTLALSTLSE